LGSAFARDGFFGDIRRAQLFEKTDFVVPKININFSNEDYNKYFLKYECEHDTNNKYLIRNEACYKAPWIDLDKIMEKAISKNIFDKSDVRDGNDLNIINKSNITLSEFEHIITTYSNHTLEQALSSTFGLVKIPDFEVDDASLSFDINGYILILMKYIYIYIYIINR
ncbi:hypothetical protein BCR36DRAFT_441196, partial [Piromyces finnis]